MDNAEAQSLDRENPWPGLAPFDEAGQEFFHGRDEDADDLLRRVRRQRLTVLFGQSGLGKTSLLSAGLFPLLRADDFLPVYLRLDYANPILAPTEQIKSAFAENLAASGIDCRAPRPDETLWAFFHDKKTEFWSRRNRLVMPVLVFDQFEEIFTVGGGGPAVAAVIAELAALIENRAPEQVREALDDDPEAAARYDFAKEGCKVILALREDFLPEFEGLWTQIPSIMHNRARLERMSGPQAREAVLRSGGHIVDDAVAERIIGFVEPRSERATQEAGASEAASLAVDPALLSIVCYELNNKRKLAGQDKITEDLLAGSQGQIVADFYKSSIADLDEAVKIFIEDQLVTGSGHRALLPLADVLMQPGITREAIDLLVGRRLLRIEDRAATQWVELTHDRLTEVIREERDARREDSRAVEEAEARVRAEHERAERAEIEALRERAERESAALRLVRRTRIALFATAAMLIVAFGTLVFAAYETRRAEELRQLAEERQQLADQRADGATKAQQLADQRAEEAKHGYALALDAAIGNINLVANYYGSGEISTELAKSMLDSARTTFGGLPEAREDVATLRARVRLFSSLADTYQAFGDLTASLDAARTAQALAERLPEADGERDSGVGYTRARIGDMLRDQGDLAGALAEYRAYLDIAQRLAEKDPGNTDSQRDLAISHGKVGDVLRDQGDLAGALAEYRAFLDITQRLAEKDPGNTDSQRGLAISHEKIGDVLQDQGDLAGALAEYRTKLEIMQRVVDKDPGNAVWQRELSVGHEKIGDVLRHQGDLTGALAEYWAKLNIAQSLADKDAGNAGWQRDLAISSEKIGDVLRDQGDLAGALAEYRAYLDIAQRLAAQDPGNAVWQRNLFGSYAGLGTVVLAQNDLPAALDAFTKGEAIAKRLKEINPTAASSAKDLDWIESHLAETRRRIAAAKK